MRWARGLRMGGKRHPAQSPARKARAPAAAGLRLASPPAPRPARSPPSLAAPVPVSSTLEDLLQRGGGARAGQGWARSGAGAVCTGCVLRRGPACAGGSRGWCVRSRLARAGPCRPQLGPHMSKCTTLRACRKLSAAATSTATFLPRPYQPNRRRELPAACSCRHEARSRPAQYLRVQGSGTRQVCGRHVCQGCGPGRAARLGSAGAAAREQRPPRGARRAPASRAAPRSRPAHIQNQSINSSTHQSINSSIHQCINPSTHQWRAARRSLHEQDALRPAEGHPVQRHLGGPTQGALASISASTSVSTSISSTSSPSACGRSRAEGQLLGWLGRQRRAAPRTPRTHHRTLPPLPLSRVHATTAGGPGACRLRRGGTWCCSRPAPSRPPRPLSPCAHHVGMPQLVQPLRLTNKLLLHLAAAGTGAAVPGRVPSQLAAAAGAASDARPEPAPRRAAPPALLPPAVEPPPPLKARRPVPCLRRPPPSCRPPGGVAAPTSCPGPPPWPPPSRRAASP